MRYLTTGILCFVSIFLFGCSPVDQLKSQLEKNICSLGYIHDSEQITNKLPSTIFVENTVVEQDLPEELVVILEKTDTMYLIIAAWQNHEFSCQLGKTVLVEEPASFITDSIKAELERSGWLSLTDTKSNADFVLTPRLLRCGSQLIYKQNFTAAGYSSIYEFSASPSVAAVSIAMNLSKDEATLIEEDFKAVVTTPYPVTGPGSSADVSRNCVENMAESFSMAIKDCVEQIVKKINENKQQLSGDSEKV